MKRMSWTGPGLLCLALALSGCASPGAGEGWIPLIDGTSASLARLERVGDANWRIEDGSVQADQGVGFLVTRESYRDFEVRAEFWVDGEANSGIYMRCADAQKITDESCYEANIFDRQPDPTYATGAVTNIANAATQLKAAGRWNVYEITVRGTRLTVTLNGVRTVDVSDTRFASGPIALQRAAGRVKFRKVDIRPL